MELPEKVDSKFRYVLVAARRAEQLVRGAQAKMETVSRKPTRIAMQEVNRGLVNWDYQAPEAPADAAVNGADDESAED